MWSAELVKSTNTAGFTSAATPSSSYATTESYNPRSLVNALCSADVTPTTDTPSRLDSTSARPMAVLQDALLRMTVLTPSSLPMTSARVNEHGNSGCSSARRSSRSSTSPVASSYVRYQSCGTACWALSTN